MDYSTVRSEGTEKKFLSVQAINSTKIHLFPQAAIQQAVLMERGQGKKQQDCGTT